MRVRFVALLLVGATVAGADALAQPKVAQEQPNALVLKVGGKKVIGVPDIARVAVGNPEVADIRVAGNDRVEVIGRASGSTVVHIWRGDGQKVTYQVTVSR